MTSQLRTALRLGIVASIGFSQACTADGTSGVDALGQAEQALDGASCSGSDYADGCLCDLSNTHTVPLYRVASRANGACLGNSVNPRYPEFEAAGVSNENQRDLYIAGITDPPPPKSQTQIMILTAAGQRPPASSGVWNRMTGQRAGYRSIFDCDQQFSWYNLHGDGLAWKLWQNPTEWRHWAGPLNVSAIFDTTSAFQTPGDEKGDLRAAYTAYVKNHIAPTGKLIYLAGSSRGACVMAGVAKNLKADPLYVNTPLVLHLVDPVCAENDGWSFGDWYDNPLNSGDYKGKGVDLSAAFSDQAKKSLSIYSIVTGDKVVLNAARAFVDVNTPPAPATTHSLSWTANGFTKTWYEQKWVDLPHEYLGRTCGEKWTIDTQLQNRYSSELARFWCAGTASFNPETQSCCPSGQYWSAASTACLAEPVCSSNGYLQPGSDPKICVECLDREVTTPAGLPKPVPQYELNDTKNGCERICPACTDFAGHYTAKEVCTKEGLCSWVKQPVCIARQCGADQVCSASTPAGQCVCDASQGLVFDVASNSCIQNPCLDEHFAYDGKRCIDQCPKLPGSTPGQPRHFDCRSGTCVGPGVFSPPYNPFTGDCVSVSTPK